MDTPKFQVGQQVEIEFPVGNDITYKRGVIHQIEASYRYSVAIEDKVFPGTYTYSEDRIRPPRPTPEEAWQKAAIIVGIRTAEKSRGNWAIGDGFDTETRHQCYQILGAAGIKITDEVKAGVRELIDIAEVM